MGPIGVFDSGVGGLTVLKAIRELMPYEDLVYFGDTARVPYGNKSQETVRRYAFENGQFLLEKGVKAIVIACNTATAHAEQFLSEQFSVPVIGVIEPAVRECLDRCGKGRIAVLATRGTLKSGAYQKLILAQAPEATIFPVHCPLFVPLVEEGMFDHPITRMTVEHYLSPLKDHAVDTVILGCTHYPLLRSLIEETLGPSVKVIDSASSCSRKVHRVLQQLDLLKDGLEPGENSYFASDDPSGFSELVNHYLNLQTQEPIMA